MTARLAILCSGQGAQHPAMFDLARSDAAAAGFLERCLPAACTAPGADLFANRFAQPMLVAAACATWLALASRLPAPVAVAGYSVGELAALAVAGVIDAVDAVVLAGIRAGAMDAAVDPAWPQGLLAVSGLPLASVRSVLVAQGATTAAFAIVNAEDQCILGGLREDAAAGPGLERLSRVLVAAGAQVSLLPVAIASHTPWMQPAVVPLAAALGKLHASPPATRLLAGISGAVSATGEAALDALLAQSTQTVRWDACMDALAEAGVTAALELGPGSGLARMMNARHPRIACRSVAQFRSLDGVAAWVMRQ